MLLLLYRAKIPRDTIARQRGAFPILNKWAGASGTFWTFGVICVVGFFFIRKYLPETKGKSLEETESFWE